MMNRHPPLQFEPRDGFSRDRHNSVLQITPRDSAPLLGARVQSLIHELANDGFHDVWISNYLKAHTIFRNQGPHFLRRGYNSADPAVSDWFERQRNTISSMPMIKRQLLSEIGLN